MYADGNNGTVVTDLLNKYKALTKDIIIKAVWAVILLPLPGILF